MKTTYWYWLWKTFLGPSRLRKKFVRTFLLAGLIPLILMGGVSIYLVNLTHRIDVEALEENLARQVAIDIRKTIERTRSIVEFTVTYSDFAPIKFDQQTFALEEFLSEDESLSEVSLICTTPDPCKIGTETSRRIRAQNDTTIDAETRNVLESPHFREAAQGKNYISPVFFKNKSPFITIAAPVYNNNGEIIAVLSGVIDLTFIKNTILADARLGETGYVYVVDETGAIISHQNDAFLNINVSHLPPLQEFFGNGNEELRELSYESLNAETVSGAGWKIEDTEWVVVAEWPRAETQELIQTITWQIIGFSVFALLLLIIIASWMALRLIEPIAKLRQGTSVIGGGNFEYRVHIKTGDELEDLGKNLNRMAENLKGLDELKELRLRTDLLSESLKKEQELSKLKDQFITTVSHQFNTPLSVINWALDAFNDENITKEKIKENTNIIAKSQKEIAAIVNDLVTLSDIGFKYQKSKAKPVDLKTLMQKTVDALTDEAKIKNVNLSFTTSIDNTVAEINEFTMSKAFANLVDNAIGYSKEGTNVSVDISGSDTELIIRVSDQGIGIPKDDQPLIFQQFYRAKNAIQKKNVGTGLGLFIVKTIVEGHGGSIWFESEENKGTSFFVKLPRKAPAKKEVSQETQNQIQPPQAPSNEAPIA